MDLPANAKYKLIQIYEHDDRLLKEIIKPLIISNFPELEGKEDSFFTRKYLIHKLIKYAIAKRGK